MSVGRRVFPGLVLALCAGLAMGDEAPATPAPAPVSGYPFEAEVAATRVRVRAGGNINDRELLVLSKGDRVTVLEEQYGWYRIRCPQGCKAWVNVKFAKEVAGTGAGSSIELTGDNVVLRAGDSQKASPMGTFPKGTTLTTVGRKGDWYEVLCPPEAAAWISAKYVTPLGGAVPPPLTQRPVETAAREPERKPAPEPADPKAAKAWSDLEQDHQKAMGQDLDKADWDGLIARYEALGREALDPAVAERSRARVAELTERKKLRDQVKSGFLQAREDLQRELDQINARYEAKLQEILETRRQPARTASDFLETGWLYGVGRMIGCPATHRLNKGNKHLCFLRSEKDENGADLVNLERFYNQYVGINGDRVFDPRWGDMIIVREIQVLGEAPKP